MTITKHAVRRAKTRGLIPRTCSRRRAVKYIKRELQGAVRYPKGEQWLLVSDKMRGVWDKGKIITVY